ncbi:hypothetical protein Leryth_026805 [Lithospermum erythrorhizon]|uniref:Uncharacterized protein n=1 Tax=Lithospermum erythrorhizon TaxID=34254 RepID=A0AAV3Q1K8_LITER|nr:hypothetical protein Leryth_026805 [Lithospermum erythrorhizon]
MAENQGIIRVHGVEDKRNNRAIVKLTVTNTSHDRNLTIDDVVGYVDAKGERFDQKIECAEILKPSSSKVLKLTVTLPTLINDISDAKIGIIIPNVGHVEIGIPK